MQNKFTKPLESSTRIKINNWLTNLNWNLDDEDNKCNVFTERTKTTEQKKKLKGKFPDYVLYKSGTDEPLAIIEAKRKGQSIEKAIEQAINLYAKPLNIDIIFAIDGAFIKSWSIKANDELYLDEHKLIELISEERLLRYTQEGNSITEATAEVKHTREELVKIFKWANDLLRKEGLRNLDRFVEFSNILFIKIISEIEDDREKRGLSRHLKKSICWDSFSNMEDEEAMLNYVNDSVLKKGLAKEYNHSDDIFQEKLKIQNPSTLKAIVKKISPLKLINTESEIKGDAFEYFLKNLASGNDLGEYFTPRHIVKLMVELLQPKLGEKILDPFCGTGGFLIEVFRYLKRGVSEKDEKLLNILKEKTLFGVELTDTYKISKMNMIITGDGHNNIVRSDTAKKDYYDKFIENERKDEEKKKFLEKFKKEKADIVLSNIPYGQETDFSNLYEVPSNSGDSIFMQNIFWALKEGGTAGIIIPEGLLYRIEHKAFRKYLLSKCEVKSIISLPSGVFYPYTGVKTSIIIFTKGSPTKQVWYFDVKNDGFELNKKRKKLFGKNDIDLLREVWTEKQENRERDYFYVNIKDIIDNDFKLSIKFYQKNKLEYNDDLQKLDRLKLIGKDIYKKTSELKKEKEMFDLEKYPTKKVKDICNILSGFAFKSKFFNSNNRGKSLIRIRDIQKGFTETSYTGEYDNRYLTKKGDLLIGMDGEFNVVIWKSENELINQRVARIRDFNSEFIKEYVFYILKKRLKEIEEETPYSTVKHISTKQISDIEIPFAPKEIQKKIAENIRAIEEVKELVKSIEALQE